MTNYITCPKCGATDKWSTFDSIYSITRINGGKIPSQDEAEATPDWANINWSGETEVLWEYQETHALYCNNCKEVTIDLTD